MTRKRVENREESLGYPGVLPNFTKEFKGALVGSMGTTNHQITWGRILCFVGEDYNNSTRRENDEPDEGMAKKT
ncbi:hypothetical protein TNCV_3254811 [Trichonephila clavipes]|nr:hypothetical protein TNCV_3254811 [Trichonephila clavipes]